MKIEIKQDGIYLDGVNYMGWMQHVMEGGTLTLDEYVKECPETPIQHA